VIILLLNSFTTKRDSFSTLHLDKKRRLQTCLSKTFNKVETIDLEAMSEIRKILRIYRI
jgi:hypothetical protein